MVHALHDARPHTQHTQEDNWTHGKNISPMTVVQCDDVMLLTHPPRSPHMYVHAQVPAQGVVSL